MVDRFRKLLGAARHFKAERKRGGRRDAQIAETTPARAPIVDANKRQRESKPPRAAICAPPPRQLFSTPPIRLN
jgi:hypothetical protein